MRALAGLLVALAIQPAAGAEALRVAAASDLIHAMPVLARRFEQATGQPVSISYGASGNLSRQILQGAGFELFFSADESYAGRLVAAGATAGPGAAYATGRLALYLPEGSPVAPEADLSGLAQALAGDARLRLAIANPEHAPYGRAARQALVTTGLWQRAQPHLVLGETAAQAARFCASGNAGAGLIPESIARSPALARRGRSVPVAEDLYRPLRQHVVLLAGAGEAGRAFYAFALGPEGREVFAGAGLGPAPR